MPTSKTDSQHRILSTRCCVAAPKLPCFLFFFLIDSSVPTLHLSTLADTHSVFCDAISLPLTPKHQSHKRSNTQLATQNNISPLDRKPPNPTWKEQTRTPLTSTHFLPCLPPRVSRPRTDVPSDSGSSVLHGQLLHSRGVRLLCTLLQDGWRHDPRDFHTRIQNYCGTRGDLSSTVTLSIPVFSVWIWYVNYCDRHCCP